MHEMLTSIDSDLLVNAFPSTVREQAIPAAEYASRQLGSVQWTDRFEVRMGGEALLIPARLRFSNNHDDEQISGDIWLMARALRTRSSDGFERQRAVRDLLADVRPWCAPFIVALLGEYLVEILDDIALAFGDSVPDPVADLLRDNPTYWFLTKQRVASYWNVYYRTTCGADYVGFKLVSQIDAAI